MTSLERERRGDVEILRLNRPEKRNALDTPTLRLLNDVLRELSDDGEIRAVVF